MSDGTEKIELKVLGLSSSNVQSGAFALILAETQGDRRIPIVIGRTEAQSIAIILDNVEIPRPLTHDLFYNFAHDFDITLKEVVIYKLEEGIFYSVLVFHKQGESGLVKIDSRTSDAVALALRFNVPIYTYEYITQEMYPKLPYTKAILSLVDVLVDGKYIEDLRDLRLQFRGSANQRVIDLRKTEQTGQIMWALDEEEQQKYIPYYNLKELKKKREKTHYRIFNQNGLSSQLNAYGNGL